MMIPAIRLLDDAFVFSRIPRRPVHSHKGTFGTALCLCGSRIYQGAALMAAEGTLRSGAGIVQLASVQSILSACVIRLPECTLLPLTETPDGSISAENIPLLAQVMPQRKSVLIGCGLTPSPDTAHLVHQLIPLCNGTVVLDADGLNVCQGGQLPHPTGGTLIVTPHPGEMASLTGKSIAEIQENRTQAALQFAKENDCITVLKGHQTVIAAPDGQVFENPTGNSGLAKGGSGDVLAGIITGMASAGLSALDAAICGVYLHGLAADVCAQHKSQTAMLPHEILQDLGTILAQHGL